MARALALCNAWVQKGPERALWCFYLMDFLRWLFDSSDWPQRWHCGEWSALHGYTHIAADLAIAGAYFAIPVALLILTLRRGRDLPFPGVFWLFCAFIMSCGLGHFIDAMMFYQPSYRVLTGVKVTTATVSWFTLIALIPVVPRALALPSIVRANAQLARENEARRAAQAALRARNHTLRQKSQELEQFVHTIAHDLKSPLVTMGGFVAIARAELNQGRHENLEENLARVERASQRLGELTQGLLDLARAGRALGPHTSVDVQALVERLAAELRARAAGSKLRIEITTPLPPVPADAGRLGAMFENMIVNAINHNYPDANGEVRIGAELHENHVHYFVSDDGPGIAPEHQQRIFGLFQRLSRNDGSTGVGLALVEKVARVHGGRVWVESTPGKGATFWVALPRVATEEPEAVDIDRSDDQPIIEAKEAAWSKGATLD